MPTQRLEAVATLEKPVAKNFPFIDEGVDAEGRRGSRSNLPRFSFRTMPFTVINDDKINY